MIYKIKLSIPFEFIELMNDSFKCQTSEKKAD